MTSKVTKESLVIRIMRLENQQIVFGLAINEEYQLEVYRMLLSFMVGAVVADELIKEQMR